MVVWGWVGMNDGWMGHRECVDGQTTFHVAFAFAQTSMCLLLTLNVLSSSLAFLESSVAAVAASAESVAVLSVAASAVAASVAAAFAAAACMDPPLFPLEHMPLEHMFALALLACMVKVRVA